MRRACGSVVSGHVGYDRKHPSALGVLSGLPTPVNSWRVEIGIDAADQPAVWVWAMLDEEEVDLDTGERLRDIVRDAVRRETGDESWVYVRFRSASDP